MCARGVDDRAGVKAPYPQDYPCVPPPLRSRLTHAGLPGRGTNMMSTRRWIPTLVAALAIVSVGGNALAANPPVELTAWDGVSVDAEKPELEPVMRRRDLRIVSREQGVYPFINALTGETEYLDGVRVVMTPRARGRFGSTRQSCTTTYTFSAPQFYGSPTTPNHVYGSGTVSVSSGCSGGVYVQFKLKIQYPVGWTTKNTHNQTVPVGGSRSFYVSKNCTSTSYLNNWLTSMTTSKIAAQFCSA